MKVFLFSLAIVCLPLSFDATGCIYQIVNSTLTSRFSLNFTIFTEDLKGVILHCIGKETNKLELSVHNESNIRITFNQNSKDVSSKQLCGCDPCRNREINFNLRTNEDKLSISCNNRKTQETVLIFEKENPQNKNTNDIPAALIDNSGSMLVMLGNVGPYITERNVTVYPHKQQMIGCLVAFKINNESVTFKETGMKMKSTCSLTCNNNICNGGLCLQKLSNVSCNCSVTALNGRYCNDSLKTYHRGARNHSYVKMRDVKEVYLKMTWNQSVDTKYCLLQFINKDKSVTIYTDNSTLVIDDGHNYNIIYYDYIGINFITVDLIMDELFFKTKFNVSQTRFEWYRESLINLGFSERVNKCETFKGSYDFYHDSAQLQQGRYDSTVIHKSTTNRISDNSTKQAAPNMATTIIIIILLILFIGCLTILVVIMKRFYMRLEKNSEKFIEKIIMHNDVASKEKDPLDSVSIDYYPVEDQNDYDAFREEPIYGTVDF